MVWKTNFDRFLENYVEPSAARAPQHVEHGPSSQMQGLMLRAKNQQQQQQQVDSCGSFVWQRQTQVNMLHSKELQSWEMTGPGLVGSVQVIPARKSPLRERLHPKVLVQRCHKHWLLPHTICSRSTTAALPQPRPAWPACACPMALPMPVAALLQSGQLPWLMQCSFTCTPQQQISLLTLANHDQHPTTGILHMCTAAAVAAAAGCTARTSLSTTSIPPLWHAPHVHCSRREHCPLQRPHVQAHKPRHPHGTSHHKRQVCRIACTCVGCGVHACMHLHLFMKSEHASSEG